LPVLNTHFFKIKRIIDPPTHFYCTEAFLLRFCFSVSVFNWDAEDNNVTTDANNDGKISLTVSFVLVDSEEYTDEAFLEVSFSVPDSLKDFCR